MVESSLNKEIYVLKKIDMTNADPDDKKFVKQEIKAMKTLQDFPCICRIREVFPSGGGKAINLVMEHCKGGDLEAVIRDRRTTGEFFTEE